MNQVNKYLPSLESKKFILLRFIKCGP